ncbi:MAG: GNAT family N-acetyltransferase, partial [Candidatus Thorarchaeota archaeon]
MKPQDLGDGLVMRNGTKEDIPAILEHFRVVHGEFVVDELRAFLEHHPRFSWENWENSFIIVSAESGEVVSGVFLLENTWTLDGIELSSAEMEAVGTLEAYRYRGHMHLLNEVFELRVSQLKPVIQAIAGIPFFYRIFGYEYAANLGGGYPISPGFIPKLPEGEEEAISFKTVDAKNFKEYLKYREKYLPQRTWYRTMRPEDAGYLIFEPTSHDQEAFFFYLVQEKGKTVGVFFLSRWENSFIIVSAESGEVVSGVFLLENTWTLDGIELSSAEM